MAEKTIETLIDELLQAIDDADMVGLVSVSDREGKCASGLCRVTASDCSGEDDEESPVVLIQRADELESWQGVGSAAKTALDVIHESCVTFVRKRAKLWFDTATLGEREVAGHFAREVMNAPLDSDLFEKSWDLK